MADRTSSAANDRSKVEEGERRMEGMLKHTRPVESAAYVALPLGLIAEIDEWLDGNVSEPYAQQPLAQDWARVAKLSEEVGEAIDALIAWTGQNPRKPWRDEARGELMDELADAALTAIYAMQHFTKDADGTARLLAERLTFHHGRMVVRNA